MNLPATIAPTLSKLVALLGSDSDGEVIATVAAIGRVLARHDRDFNDLAKAIWPSNGAMASMVAWRANAEFCAKHLDKLSSRESKFIGDLMQWRGTPSSKQLDWLAAITAKLWAE